MTGLLRKTSSIRLLMFEKPGNQATSCRIVPLGFVGKKLCATIAESARFLNIEQPTGVNFFPIFRNSAGPSRCKNSPCGAVCFATPSGKTCLPVPADRRLPRCVLLFCLPLDGAIQFHHRWKGRGARFQPVQESKFYLRTRQHLWDTPGATLTGWYSS